MKSLKEIIEESKYIVFFGGAGVSTASNIPDFRSQDGLYNLKYKYPPEEIISHSFFMEHTVEFYQFYKDKMVYPDAKPNIAHIKLAELEKKGKLKAIITQNIDNLHQLAGSKNVIELHGNIYRNYCMKCHKEYDIDYILNSEGVPKCQCGGIIKPDVVLYEEILSQESLANAINEIRKSDTLIVAGTSLTVYPAASLIRYFIGQNLVIINKEKTPFDAYADLVIHEPIEKVFSEI
ncbi:MAG TPA: NAD-dependent protein deacylase [Bacilli bacterium]